MDMEELVKHAAVRLADAIARRDVSAIRELMAPGFVHRSHGGVAVDTDAFLQAIEQIPGTIMSVRLEHVEVDSLPTGGLVTGVQHARVFCAPVLAGPGSGWPQGGILH